MCETCLLGVPLTKTNEDPECKTTWIRGPKSLVWRTPMAKSTVSKALEKSSLRRKASYLCCKLVEIISCANAIKDDLSLVKVDCRGSITESILVFSLMARTSMILC